MVMGAVVVAQMMQVVLLLSPTSDLHLYLYLYQKNKLKQYLCWWRVVVEAVIMMTLLLSADAKLLTVGLLTLKKQTLASA
jgi:hypothetical protein